MGKYDLIEDAPVAPTSSGAAWQEAEARGMNDNVLTRSLRGGILGAGSQLASLGDATAEAYGLTGVSEGLRGVSKGLRAQAALPENSPKVGSFTQLREDPTLSNVGEYLGGLVGGSAPSMAAGVGAALLTRGRSLGASMGAAAAAQAPLEMGDVVQKQQADPEVMAQPAGERLRGALFGGGASALAQGVVPGLVGRQMLGKAGSSIGNESVKSILGRNAMDIPMEGLAEGGGSAIKQFAANQDKPLDWNEIGESAIGGAAAGGVFSGIGAGADLVSQRGNGVATAVGGAVDAVGKKASTIADRVRAGKETVQAEAPKRMNSLSEDLGELFQQGRGAADKVVEKVRTGEVLGDLKEFAGAAPERIKEMMDLSDNETAQRVQEWGAQMMNDAGLTPERRAEVADALSKAGDRAGQMAMAGLKKSWDATQRAKEKLDKLHRTFKNRPVDVDATEVKNVRIGDGDIIDVEAKKFSNDYSGSRRAIASKLGPLLAASKPELVGNEQLMDGIAEGARKAVGEMGTEQLSSDTLFSLIDMLGDDTAATLDAAFRAVGDQSKAEQFYTRLNEIAETQARSRSLNELIASSLTEQSRELIADDQIGEFAELLKAHAKGERVSPNAGPAQRAAAERHFREQFVRHFGENADAVSLAIEKEVGMGKAGDGLTEDEVALTESGTEAELSDGGFDKDGNRVQAEPLDVVRKGRGKNNEPVMDPELFRSRGEQGQNYAAQYIKDLQAKYPDHNVRFEKAEGSSTHGYVVAEKAQDKDALTDADIDSMRLDTKKWAKSKDRIEVGGNVLDTRRIAKALDKRMPYSQEGQSRAARLAEMFNAGVARLMERYGTFDVPDSVVIGTVAGRDMTFGEAKKLDQRTAADQAADARTNRMTELRAAYKDAKAEGVPGAELAKIRAEYVGLVREQAAEVDSELGAGDDIQGRSPARRAEVRGRGPVKDEATGTRRVNNGTAEDFDTQDADKAGNIHEAAKRIKSDKLVNRSNMDGSEHSPTALAHGPGFNMNYAVMTAKKLMRSDNAIAAKIGKRLDTMLGKAHVFSERDLHKLMWINPDMPAAEVAETINPLARKYKDVIAAPQGTAKEPSRKVETSTEDKFMANLEYLNNPPENYTTARAREILAWAQKNKDFAGMSVLIKKAESVLEGDASLVEFEGGTPDPKAVAAKKAAFLERAASGDKALLKELSTSTDAKGLQRAADALPPGEALDVVNARLAELVQDPDVAYGMQTKKYSLMSTRIHNDLGREGFAATHDSPIKHEGKFDWRAHQGKGEGNASFGAGTYLSTAEGVHRNYKSQFTAMTDEYGLLGELASAERELMNAKSDLDEANAARAPENWEETKPGVFEPTEGTGVGFVIERDGQWGRGYIAVHNEYDVPLGSAHRSLQGVLDAMITREELGPYQDAYASAKKAYDRAKQEVEDSGITKSPTYEVSVDIPAEQLLDWDAPLNEQTATVRLRAMKAIKDNDLLFYSPVTGGEGPMTFDKIGRALYIALAEKLGSQAAASEYLQSLGILGHKYAAAGGRNDTHPNYVIYDDSKINTNYVHFSAQSTAAAATVTAAYRKTVEAHINKVLASSVRVEWANLTHAGEFERMKMRDVIRLSVHALDPMSTAYHESLHAFFAQLRDAGATDVMNVITKAASSEHVMAQLRDRYASEPGVLAQLSDPEERAAYMYQTWANDPTFTIDAPVKTAFQKIAAFIRKVLGIWSNDERALHILDYFHSGQYIKHNTAVRRLNMMGKGRNGALEAAKGMAKPLAGFADAVVATGSGRLRATEIPALKQLADIIKREHTDDSGKDAGFIAAARLARTERLNALGEVMSDYTQDQMNEAMEALQSGTRAANPEARLAVRAIKGVLAETREYMIKAGVDIGDLGPDYFPRVWDTHYISKNMTAFKDMLEPYKRNGTFKGDIDSFVARLSSRDGAEIGIETREPGMQFRRERLLAFIDPADAAPFVQKNLLGTLSSYITQATRRAEWNRRLGGGKLETLFKEATAQGATPEQLKLADSYLRGVDGTLGDGINPTLRRLMGNMIVYQNIRLLPLAVFSSVVDPVGVMVRGGTVGDAWATFKRGIAEIPQSYGRKPSTDEATQLAELVGVVDSAMLSSVMGDLYTQGMVGGTAQKINTAFFKYNMMEGLNRSFRVGASEAAMKFIARHASGQHSIHSARWMKELGLRAGDVVMTPAGRMALTEADGLTAEQSMRVRSAINMWVDGAVLRPDSADKPIWMNDPHYALIAHFKQFVYSFQKVILARVAHEVRQGNYTPVMALAAYVPVMIASDFTKGLIQGGGEQPEWKKGWDMSDYLSHGVQRAGLLGVGQFGWDVKEDMERGNSGLGALAGPTVEQFIKALEVMGGNREFGPMLLKSMPANALYGGLADGPDPAPVIER